MPSNLGLRHPGESCADGQGLCRGYIGVIWQPVPGSGWTSAQFGLIGVRVSVNAMDPAGAFCASLSWGMSFFNITLTQSAHVSGKLTR